jgi:hypothetical protein
MKRTTAIAWAAGIVSALGCTLPDPNTEVTADDFDITPLIGVWSGEYSSDQTGRHGDISFTLRPAEGAASGFIEMVARKSDNVVVTADRPMVTGLPAAEPRELLTIHFVRKEGNRVVGILDPYTDPDCACRVTTTFQGSFTSGRTIEGVYNTIGSELAHTATGGRWKVTRVKRL